MDPTQRSGDEPAPTDVPTALPTEPDPSIDPYATRSGDGGVWDGSAQGFGEGIRYRAVKFHAQGGLGEVHLALDTELQREVALKQIKPGFDAIPSSRERFLHEAQITGALEHPGIVPVYGLGTYPDGRPFYAMRFIQGGTLDQEIRDHYAAVERDPSGRTLGLRALLRRFIDVCHAIAFAHSRGILHRDIKPANVMVGTYGETLVVDWGLAVHMQADTPDQPDPRWPYSSRISASGAGTPSYMSPEQVQGLEGTNPRSDIYSLGATLYQILTGRRSVEAGSVTEIFQQVLDGQIPPARRIRPDVPRPLDAICRKAMAHAPDDRYATASELAADLERWLADEPVAAYRETAPERLARWTRRHRQATVSAGLALVAVAAVAVSASFVINRARRSEAEARSLAESNFQKARSVVDSVITELAERQDLKETPRGDAFRRKLLTEARDYYREFVKDQAHSTDPSVLRESAGTARRLARIESETGDRQRAIEGYDEAVGILVRLLQKAPADRVSRESLGASLVSRSILLHQLGQLADAERDVRQAYSIFDLLAIESPSQPTYRRDALRALNNLAILLAATGRSKEAEDAQRRVLAGREALYKAQPESPDAREDLAASLGNLANLESTRGDFPAALASINRAIELTEARLKDRPDAPEPAYLLAEMAQTRGDLLAQTNDLDRAKSSYEQALNRLDRLVADHPGVSAYLRSLARAEDRLGVFAEGTGGDPEPHYANASRHFEALMRRHPQLVDAPRELGNVLGRIGERRLKQGQLDGARAALTRANQLLEASVSKSSDRRLKADLAHSRRNLARLHEAQDRPDEARRELTRAIELLSKVQASDPGVARYRTDMADALEHSGDLSMKEGNAEGGIFAFTYALGILGPLLEAGKEVTLARLIAMSLWGKLARANAEAGHDEDARTAATQAIHLARAERKARPNDDATSTLSGLLELAADLDEDADRPALAARTEVVELRRSLSRSQPKNPDLRNHLGNALVRLAEAHRDADQPAEAMVAIKEAISIHSELLTSSEDDGPLRSSLSAEYGILGELLRERGQFTAAVRAARSRRALWRIMEPDPAELAETAADFAALIEHDQALKVDALETLKAALDAGLTDLSLFRPDGPFRNVQGNPRYDELINRLRDRLFPADPFAR